MGVLEAGLQLANQSYSYESCSPARNCVEKKSLKKPESDQVVLSAEHEEGTKPVEQPSFFTRAVQWVVNLGRGLVNGIKQPFCRAFNFVQGCRVRNHLESIADERGNDDQSLRTFHASHEFDLANPDNERALFRYYRSNSDKPAVILVLGNSQNFDEDAGINRLAQRLHQDGHPVLALRAGNVLRGLSYGLHLSSNPGQNVCYRYESNRQIIDDLRQRRGIFSDLRSSGCVLGGYSLGAGTVVRYTHEQNSNNGIPIIAGVCMDGIDDPLELGIAERRRPKINGPVINIHQNNSYCLNGEPHDDSRHGDVTLCFSNETHNSIDERAVEPAYNFLRRVVSRANSNTRP